MKTIFFWLCEVFRIAYWLATEEEHFLVRLKGHKEHNVAPTVLIRKNFAVHQVLWAGT